MPTFDSWTINAWDPDAGSNSSGIIPDAVGTAPLYAVVGTALKNNWDGEIDQADITTLVAQPADIAGFINDPTCTITFWVRYSGQTNNFAGLISHAPFNTESSSAPVGSWWMKREGGSAFSFLHRASGFQGGATSTSSAPAANTWAMYTVRLGANQWLATLNNEHANAAYLAWSGAAKGALDQVLKFAGPPLGANANDISDGVGSAENSNALTGGVDTGFRGRFGDIRIHDKILSDAEINALHTAGRQSYYEGVPYEPESVDLFKRMTVPPPVWRRGVINTAIASLKAGGVWDRLSALYMLKAADKQSAYLNWIQSQTITESGTAVTHVADQYSEGLLTGDTDFLQTPNGIDSKFTETDAHYGVQIDFVRSYQKPVGSFGTFDASILDDNSSTGMRGRMHNGAFYTWGGLDPAHYLLSQASGALTPYKNGTASSSPITQTAPSPDGTFRLLRGDGFGSPPNYRISAFHLGQSLTSTQVTTLHNALQAYFSAIDAGPPRSSPVFRSSSQTPGTGSTPRPAGVVSGDLMVGYFWDYVAGGVITLPSGWTIIGSQVSNSDFEMKVAYKIAGGSEPGSYTHSSSLPDYPSAIIAAYTAGTFDAVAPIGANSTATGSGLTKTAPSVTAPYANSNLLVYTAGYPQASTSGISGMTLVEDVDNQNYHQLYRQAIPDYGATGTRSQTQGSGDWLATSVLINGAIDAGLPMSGAAAIVATASGALTKTALLSGTALSDVGSAIAPLSVTKRLVGVASAVLAATADLSATGNQSLSGSAVAVATASAPLGKVARLAGTALSDVGSAIAPLSVGKPVGGAASNVASASAGLSVSGTLSGVALVIATAASAGLSKTATLAGTGATLASASAGLTVSGTLSGVALVIATAASAGLSKTATLSGSALSDVQPVVAPLAVSKPLGGTLAALSTATADLLAIGSMSGAALSVVGSTGALSKTAPIEGLAAGLTSAAATPTVAKPLVAPALAEAQAAAALGKVATLAGSASGLSSALASFAGDASVSGSAAGLASASASLAKTAALAGTALTVASAAATMAGEAALAAGGLSTASAQATLSKESLLAAVAVVDVASTGDLSAAGALGLSGEASVVSLGSANLSVLKDLAGPAQVIAAASASVTTTSLGPTGRIVMTIKPVTLLMEATAETLARPGIRRINQVA